MTTYGRLSIIMMSRLEKESKYSSTLLPTGDLPRPKNSYDDLASAAGMYATNGS